MGHHAQAVPAGRRKLARCARPASDFDLLFHIRRRRSGAANTLQCGSLAPSQTVPDANAAPTVDEPLMPKGEHHVMHLIMRKEPSSTLRPKLAGAYLVPRTAMAVPVHAHA
jgi:hypothetical protein